MQISNVDADSGNVKVLKYSTIAIFSVFFVEAILGLVVGSLAILSDSLHALLDTLSSLMLFIAMRASIKPPDEEHMYGHEKFEPIGSLIGGFVLIILAALIAANSTLKITSNEVYIDLRLGFAGFIALGYTFCIDIFRIFIFRLALKDKSSVVKAGFYHAILDLGSTLIALFGFWLATYGVFYGDPIASLTLSSLLVLLSGRLVWRNIIELSDTAPKDAVNRVKEEISSMGGVFKYEGLRVRKSGEKFFVRATLKFPDYISLEEAHGLSAKIESNIVKALGNADISFHIEPYGTKGMATEVFIEKLVGEVKDVKGVHDVKIAYSEGRLYITLHVQVDPLTPISEAHKIAERIENAIARGVENIENILVHIEPASIEYKKGQVADKEEIKNIIEKVVEKHRGELKIKRMTTYISDGKRYVNIECALKKEVSVEDAHKIASQVEDAVRDNLSETVVTVHIEPS